jgi:hypothetical protein
MLYRLLVTRLSFLVSSTVSTTKERCNAHTTLRRSTTLFTTASISLLKRKKHGRRSSLARRATVVSDFRRACMPVQVSSGCMTYCVSVWTLCSRDRSRRPQVRSRKAAGQVGDRVLMISFLPSPSLSYFFAAFRLLFHLSRHNHIVAQAPSQPPAQRRGTRRQLIDTSALFFMYPSEG